MLNRRRFLYHGRRMSSGENEFRRILGLVGARLVHILDYSLDVTALIPISDFNNKATK